MEAVTAGIYIHIPFCLRKCGYCDFYSITDLSLKPLFLKALAREVALAEPGALVFDTIYFGGGTPSVLEPAEVERIVDALTGRFPFEGAVEITLESNPGTLTPAKLRGYRQAGANRLSIGVQSFRQENLHFLGRIHAAAEAGQCLEWARQAGFENLGIDLIYGLPGQGRSAWLQDLTRAAAHRPEHLACYMLTVEPGTPLDAQRQAGRFRPAPDGEVADLFMATAEFLEAHGYRHYEISNFARREAHGASAVRVSRHNSKYWAFAPYLGFGPAAHSYLPPERFWNPWDVRRYMAEVGSGRVPRCGRETLTAEQQMLEAIMLGLRTSEGIHLAGFHRRFDIDFEDLFGKAAAELVREGLLTISNDCCAPTRRGMLFHDTVTAALAGQLP